MIVSNRKSPTLRWAFGTMDPELLGREHALPGVGGPP